MNARTRTHILQFGEEKLNVTFPHFIYEMIAYYYYYCTMRKKVKEKMIYIFLKNS